MTDWKNHAGNRLADWRRAEAKALPSMQMYLDFIQEEISKPMEALKKKKSCELLETWAGGVSICPVVIALLLSQMVRLNHTNFVLGSDRSNRAV